MSGRLAAYGFLGKWPGSSRSNAYRMPSSVAAPLRDWELFTVVLWPDVFHDSDLLLSVKAEREYGRWEELLPEPLPLRTFTPADVDVELALAACVPEKLRSEPGGFHTFVGEAPLSWVRLGDRRGHLRPAPRGPVAVRWQGKLRGLLLLGMKY